MGKGVNEVCSEIRLHYQVTSSRAVSEKSSRKYDLDQFIYTSRQMQMLQGS